MANTLCGVCGAVIPRDAITWLYVKVVHEWEEYRELKDQGLKKRRTWSIPLCSKGCYQAVVEKVEGWEL